MTTRPAMIPLLRTIAALSLLASPVLAGDATAGAEAFTQCRACHSIIALDDKGREAEVIERGGKTGPNLWGILGRRAASYPKAPYGTSLTLLGETGFAWDTETLAAYVTDPKAFLVDALGDEKARSNMTFRLDDPAAVVDYLAGFGPEAGAD